MITFYNSTIELTGVSEDKYTMLLDFLEDNKIDYEETEIEEYTIDDRSENEKYDDWLWTLADQRHDENMLGE